jgi:hypothetical protein
VLTPLSLATAAPRRPMGEMKMTANEIKTIQAGFAHLVDNGYSTLTSANDIIKVLKVSLERARRERNIGKARFEDTSNADTVIGFLEPTIRNLEMRLV